MEVLIICVVMVLVGFFVTRSVNRRLTQSDTQPALPASNNFVCPYCTIEVTGAQSIDIINHVLCISRAEDDIELMKKRAAEVKKKDEWFIDYGYEWNDNPGSEYMAWNYDTAASKWWKHKYTIFLNGKVVEYGLTKTKSSAENQAARALKLLKYKHQHKALTSNS